MGMLGVGKMPAGVDNEANMPMSSITSAMHSVVYGRRSASRTIHIGQDLRMPAAAHAVAAHAPAHATAAHATAAHAGEVYVICLARSGSAGSPARAESRTGH